MRFCFAAAIVMLGATFVPAAAADRPDIEIHAVADCADSVAPPQVDPNTHQEICVAPTMIVGGLDVTGMRGVTARGMDMLEVELSEKASATLFHYTLSRVSHRIAILVDGKLVSAPILEQPLISRKFQIPGFSKAQIAAFIERFKIGPPI
jgi:preprotein translocase subunit SecD